MDGCETIRARVRAIVEDPLGQETRDVLALESDLIAIREATPYELALMEQKIAHIKKAAKREKFTLIDGGRA